LKNVASFFPKEALAELKAQLGIELSNEKDYSEDELSDLYNKITEDFPYAYDSDTGGPLHLGRIFESIVDTFLKNGLVETGYPPTEGVD